MKPIITTVLFLIFLSGCNSNRDFKSVDEFKHWIAGKTFTSDGKDLDQYDSHGTYGSPVGTLVLQFNGDKLTYQNCQPASYSSYKDGNDWIVGFKPCSNGDVYELVIPPSGDMYVRSLDYDISHMEEGASSSAVDKLDAIVSKKVTRGPTMEITEDREVEEPKPLTQAQTDSAKKANTAVLPDPHHWVMADTNKHHNHTATVDTPKESKIRKIRPIGADTTALILQTETDKGSIFHMSDKLPLSYQNGSTIFTFGKIDGSDMIQLDCYNEKGLYATFSCLHQGVFLYVNGGMQDIFTCSAGVVQWHNAQTNTTVQLYQVKITTR